MRVQAGQRKRACCASCARGLGAIRPACADAPDDPTCCTDDDTDPACDPHVFHGAGAGFDSASAVGAAGGGALPPGSAPPVDVAPLSFSTTTKTSAPSGVTITKAGCDTLSRDTMIGGALVGVVGGIVVGALVGYFSAR